MATLAGMGSCFHAGQGCAIQTRMLFPRSRYDEGVELLKGVLSGVPYGDPQRPDVLMGPVISAKQRDRILGYVAKGVEEGATLALGGSRPADLLKGYYIEPTLFTDVDNSMTIAQEEIFGPVLVAIPFDDDDDAVRIANRQSVRTRGRRLVGIDRARQGPSPTVSAQGRSTSTVATRTGLTCRSAATSTAGSDVRTAALDSSSNLETKALAWPRA